MQVSFSERVIRIFAFFFFIDWLTSHWFGFQLRVTLQDQYCSWKWKTCYQIITFNNFCHIYRIFKLSGHVLGECQVCFPPAGTLVSFLISVSSHIEHLSDTSEVISCSNVPFQGIIEELLEESSYYEETHSRWWRTTRIQSLFIIEQIFFNCFYGKIMMCFILRAAVSLFELLRHGFSWIKSWIESDSL